jgi:hypothetical protein
MKKSDKIARVKSVVKQYAQQRDLAIDKNVHELNIDLSKPRLIPIKGTDHKGNEVIWHLKVTQKGRLVLL